MAGAYTLKLPLHLWWGTFCCESRTYHPNFNTCKCTCNWRIMQPARFIRMQCILFHRSADKFLIIYLIRFLHFLNGERPAHGKLAFDFDFKLLIQRKKKPMSILSHYQCVVRKFIYEQTQYVSKSMALQVININIIENLSGNLEIDIIRRKNDARYLQVT